MKISEETECPVCENHCPSDNLRCPRGGEHFGVKVKGRPPVNVTPEAISAMPTEDAVILLLRKCGHYLHHNVGHGEDVNKQLLSSLSEDERKELIKLLQKCTQDWKQL